MSDHSAHCDPKGSSTSHDPRTGDPVATVPDATASEVAAAVDRALRAEVDTAAASPGERAAWLEAVADALLADTDALVDLADRETALGRPRLEAELARTASQLRFYARVGLEGSWLRATYDEATDAAGSLARACVPLGPVAVFGASNFPFAFGVLGNDTASALVAGCPVVAKAHAAHAGTCARLADVARGALAAAGAPAGTFEVLHGFEAGTALVRAPGVAAVGFTGSQAGGLALWRLAQERPEVIPFYAEMGTVNPAVVTAAGAQDIDSVAAGFVASFTLGSGQFCTKPGLLLVPAGNGAPDAVAAHLRAAAPDARLLTASIARGAAEGVEGLVAAGAEAVEVIAPTPGGWAAPAAVLKAPATALRPGSALLEEVFGPVALVVEYAGADELDAALGHLQGCLAATVIAPADDPDAPALLARLGSLAGRVTLNDWPTGVAWSWGQQHGGPWPATTRPDSTSVGAAALDRFVRPVTFQSVPLSMLPRPLDTVFAPGNPWQVPVRLNGRVVAP